MVQGLAELSRKLKAIPNSVLEEVTAQLEKEAGKIVSEMNALKPIPEITVGWTWGDAPAGAVTIGQVRGREFGRIAITIFATANTKKGSRPAIARWFEFGTKDRYHDSGKYTGKISQSPYFFPVWRSNRTRFRGNLSRAVTRGVRKA